MSSLPVPSGTPFTSAMAAAGGLSPRGLRRLLASGQVRHLLHDVYVGAPTPDSLDLRARAAALVLPEHAVVCDTSAAWLHGINLVPLAALDVSPRLDAVSIDGSAVVRRPGIRGGKRVLRRDEITSVEGIRVTTPVRTACDVARLRGRLRAIAALDAFRRSFAITEAELWHVVPRLAGHRGVIQLRELVPLSTARADSQPESWVRLMIHDEGLPMPQPQVWTMLPDGRRVRMENAYAHLRIAVEYDGEEFHTAPDDREHDEERREELRRAGWLVIVVRKDGLGVRERMVWLRRLASAISDREPAQSGKRMYSRGPDEPNRHRRR
ncbi:hypothetical protein GUY44_17750 [Pimelobacter simplex]|uniref:Uncharacterized protein n=1 Tax=Nocardioides simplex TaxID=2045 RepID=A0A0C5XBL6_NOCSI|nr:hypothetical protein [Pimelobacter simplex]AJR18680.1 hypothetical protein KR76_21865 [Pimelobacter simplex]MCG8152336.1 hypothetical protein [Pimelobacter simplex]GEB14451.1 hypothetical protein NSI01_27660 [Pimelobacter simplex]SFM29510.1 Transcriptional regulator, AbiEi antitoxin, Type IV TA system [Pimelobacter simplex]